MLFGVLKNCLPVHSICFMYSMFDTFSVEKKISIKKKYFNSYAHSGLGKQKNVLAVRAVLNSKKSKQNWFLRREQKRREKLVLRREKLFAYFHVFAVRNWHATTSFRKNKTDRLLTEIGVLCVTKKTERDYLNQKHMCTTVLANRHTLKKMYYSLLV